MFEWKPVLYYCNDGGNTENGLFKKYPGKFYIHSFEKEHSANKMLLCLCQEARILSDLDGMVKEGCQRGSSVCSER